MFYNEQINELMNKMLVVVKKIQMENEALSRSGSEPRSKTRNQRGKEEVGGGANMKCEARNPHF